MLALTLCVFLRNKEGSVRWNYSAAEETRNIRYSQAGTKHIKYCLLMWAASGNLKTAQTVLYIWIPCSKTEEFDN